MKDYLEINIFQQEKFKRMILLIRSIWLRLEMLEKLSDGDMHQGQILIEFLISMISTTKVS